MTSKKWSHPLYNVLALCYSGIIKSVIGWLMRHVAYEVCSVISENEARLCRWVLWQICKFMCTYQFKVAKSEGYFYVNEYYTTFSGLSPSSSSSPQNSGLVLDLDSWGLKTFLALPSMASSGHEAVGIVVSIFASSYDNFGLVQLIDTTSRLCWWCIVQDRSFHKH